MAAEHTDDTWTYTCPDCGFQSIGWSTKKLATERGAQHENEHATGELMDPMHEFTAERGI